MRAIIHNMKNHRAQKDELHAVIVKIILDGLPLPEGAGKSLEKVLPSICERLKNKDKFLTDEEHKQISKITYRDDAVEQTMFAREFKDKGFREVIENRTC